MQYDKLELFQMLDLMIGIPGRILNASKSDSNIIYNANLFIDKEKVWFGDFRKHESHRLRDMARLFGKKIYLLYEMDGRFENESNPKLEKAVFAFDEKGKEIK